MQEEIVGRPAVVIYCAGGDCDDSEKLAASLVRQGSVRQESIFIYRGGILDWKQEGRPLEGKGE